MQLVLPLLDSVDFELDVDEADDLDVGLQVVIDVVPEAALGLLEVGGSEHGDLAALDEGLNDGAGGDEHLLPLGRAHSDSELRVRTLGDVERGHLRSEGLHSAHHLIKLILHVLMLERALLGGELSYANGLRP